MDRRTLALDAVQMSTGQNGQATKPPEPSLRQYRTAPAPAGR
jgi:hypothetical protein